MTGSLTSRCKLCDWKYSILQSQPLSAYGSQPSLQSVLLAALLIGCRFPEQLADWCSCGNQLVVGSLQGHELVVRSFLNQKAPGHDSDNVRLLNGRQAMGDNDAGPALSGFVQGLLHSLSRAWKHTREAQIHTQAEPISRSPTQQTHTLYNYSNFTIMHWLLSLECSSASVHRRGLFAPQRGSAFWVGQAFA